LVVINATPLIFLARIGKLRKVVEYFGQAVIPEAVYDEVVRRGMALGKPEADLVEELISDGRVRVEKVKKAMGEVKGAHSGEAEALSLAKERGDALIVDDRAAYEYARMMGIKALRSVRVMLNLLKDKRLTLNDLEENLLRLSRSGFWLTADVYARIVEEARVTSNPCEAP